MGGGDWPQQQQDPYMDYLQQQHYFPQVVEPEEENIANELLEVAIDYGAGWYVVVFAVVGALTIFKKKIKAWIQS